MSAYRMSRARRAAIVACVSVVAATGVVGLRPFDAPCPVLSRTSGPKRQAP